MISEQQFISLANDIEIHANVYECGSPIWLIVTHGVGEHSERHNFLVELFSGKFNILFYDLRGHGLSSGKRVYIEDFSDFAKDLQQILLYLKSRYRMERFVLYGHSMGGLITADFLKHHAHKDLYPELVYLSSPPVGVGGVIGKIVNQLPSTLFTGLTQFPFSFRLGGLVDLSGLSHDPQVAIEARKDKLCAHSLHTKLGIELVKSSRMVFDGPLYPHCPAFVSIGTGDNVVSPESLINYFTKVETDFTLKVFPEAYHEIHFEIERFRKPYLDFMKESVLSILK